MRSLPMLALAALVLACLAAPVLADTPADCQYDEFLGTWSLFGSDSGCKNLDCSHALTVHDLGSVKFVSPNLVVADDGSRGNFTMIYNQGVEWWLNGRIYFFFSAYTGSTSHCDRSQIGWAHNADGSNWNCLRALRTSRSVPAKTLLTEDGAAPRRFAQQPPAALSTLAPQQRYVHDLEFLRQVNEAQSLFTVAPYPEFEEMTLGELQQRSGVAAPIELPKVARAPLTGPVRSFPTSFDWRNVSGQNFVTPVRSQASCGSCYAFSALAMMEARVRVQSGNKLQPFFSPQEVVSCSKYSQGCNGGFNYLIAKHGRDYGYLSEECYPYEGKDSATCSPPQKSWEQCDQKRWKVNEYYYVGGYYGMSTEDNIKEELMANGPIAVSFMVYDDFRNYRGGIYTHKFTSHLRHEFNPFAVVNHAVLLVGWGEENGMPYWSIKNSWGPEWGEGGYFRIIRGQNDCNVESKPVAAIAKLD